jgi:hypothetical protein
MAQWKFGEDTTNLRLRVGPELLAKLEKARQALGRTLSGEIITRLEQSFARDRERLAAFENARAVMELAADIIQHAPPAEAERYLRKASETIRRAAAVLREEQERA